MSGKTSLIALLVICALMSTGGVPPGAPGQPTSRAVLPTSRALQATSRPKEKHEGPTYFVIPIKGEFGVEITDELFKKCLNLAQRRSPTVVILEIDSGGGSYGELIRMIESMAKYDDLRLVAYVKEAASAAAFLTMACKEIVVSPKGAIGACVIYKKTPFGTPENIQEKFESFERARCRAAAAAAGHDPLLVEGMMRTDISLSVISTKGRPKVVEGEEGRILKREGSILTLTAQEAVACGLAVGTAEDLEGVRKLLNIDQWKEASRSAKGLYAARKRTLDQAVERYEGAMRQVKKLVERCNELKGKSGQTGMRIKLLKRAEQYIERAEAVASDYPRVKVFGGIAAGDPTEMERVRRLKAHIIQERKLIEANRPKRPRRVHRVRRYGVRR